MSKYKMNTDILKKAIIELFNEVDWCDGCDYDQTTQSSLPAPCNVCACLKIIFYEQERGEE